MLNNSEFSNFISGFQFSLLAQSLLSVGITQPRTLVVMLYLSIILGLTNIFMKNVEFTYSVKPEYSSDLHEEIDTEHEDEHEVEHGHEDENEVEHEHEDEHKPETKEDNNVNI
jgi:ABC-type nickel/cobalt efflux system permease component RcnA